jgi:antirestriction protein ArdC
MSITRTDTYQRITDMIIDALEAGTRPWVKPWNDRDPGTGLPRPLRAGGEPYRGINILLLWIACATHGFQQGRFMTYSQAQERGGQVRKGEKGTTIVKYGTITRMLEGEAGQEREREIPYLKAYSVFEVSQIDNLPPEFYGAAEPLGREQRLDHVDQFICNTGAVVEHSGSRACYIPSVDLIRMPRFLSFDTPESYYSTLLHEVTHWVGAPKRLDRLKTTNKAHADYHFEELVAEIGACFLCADLRIAATVRPESASYIDGWLAVMKQDKRAIFQAASKAQAAADYLHSLQP